MLRAAALTLTFAALAHAQTAGTELKRLRVLIVMDTDSDLADSLAIDRGTVRGAFEVNVPKARRTVDVLDGKKATPANVLQAVRDLKVVPREEALLVFFGGHGAMDVSKGHYLQLQGGPLLRRDLRQAMLDTKAPLVVLLTDCCSSAINLPKKKGVVTEMIVKEGPDGPPPVHPVYSELFFKARGLVDVTAARPGTPSWGDNENGGLFTSAVCRMLVAPLPTYDRNKDGVLTWSEFVAALGARTDADFKAWKGRIPERERASVKATTQRAFPFQISEKPRVTPPR